jgi:hypothetical protein
MTASSHAVIAESYRPGYDHPADSLEGFALDVASPFMAKGRR